VSAPSPRTRVFGVSEYLWFAKRTLDLASAPEMAREGACERHAFSAPLTNLRARAGTPAAQMDGVDRSTPRRWGDRSFDSSRALGSGEAAIMNAARSLNNATLAEDRGQAWRQVDVATQQAHGALAADREWRNIADIVPSTLKMIMEVVEAQSSRIAELEALRTASDKRLRSDVGDDLLRVEALIKEAEGRMAERLRAAEVNWLGQAQKMVHEAEAALRTELAKHRAEVDRAVDAKADRGITEANFEAIRRQYDALEADAADRARETWAELKKKADASALEQLRADTVSHGDLVTSIQNLQNRMEAECTGMIARAVGPVEQSLSDAQDDIRRLVKRIQKDGKAAGDALKAVGEAMERMDGAIEETKRQAGGTQGEVAQLREAHSTSVGDLRALLEKKSDLREVADELNRHWEELSVAKKVAMDAADASVAAGEAASRVEAEQRAAVRRLEEDSAASGEAWRKAVAELSGRADATEDRVARIARDMATQVEVDGIREDVAVLHGLVEQRALVKDVVTLLDTKADVDEVSDLLKSVQVDVDQGFRASGEALRKALDRQAAVNRALNAQVASARFVWGGDKTLKNHVVPWDTCAVNSDPETFLCNEGTGEITIASPGLYEVTLGFFSQRDPGVYVYGSVADKPPTVQLLLDKARVQASMHKSTVLLPAGAPRTRLDGISAREFLALPRGGTITATFQGRSRETVQGFLSVRKL